VQEEPAEEVAGEFVHPLFVAAGAQGGGDQCLGFAAGEQGRAMRAGKHADLDFDGPDVGEAAPVDARVGLDHQAAHLLLEQVVERVADVARALLEQLRAVLFGERGLDLFFQRVDGVVPRLFLHGAQRLGQPVLRDSRDVGCDLLVCLRRFVRHLFDAAAAAQFLDAFDNRLDVAVPEFDGAEHDLFGDFSGGAFDHGDGVARARHDHVNLADFHVLHRRVHDELAVDQADAHRADGLEQRNLRDVQGGRSRVDRNDIRVVDVVRRQHGLTDLQFVAESLWKQGPQRPVGQPAHEDFPFRGTGLAPEKVARDLPYAVEFFPVIHREGEEILPGLGLGRDAYGREHHGLADAADDGAVRLFCDAAGLKIELPIAYGYGKTFH